MPINAVSDSFTQLPTSSSVIQEGAAEGSPALTGFIKPSYIFQPRPPLDTDIKRRERNAGEGGKSRRRRLLSFQPGSGPWIHAGDPEAPGSSAAPSPTLAACRGQGLCQLRWLLLAKVKAASHLCLGKCPRLSPACRAAGKALR